MNTSVFKMLQLLAVAFQLFLAGEDEVAGGDLLPAGLVGVGIVMALGIVDDQLLLPGRDGVWLMAESSAWV